VEISRTASIFHPVRATARESDKHCPDISGASERLNWQPRVPLKTGLERTIMYFEGVLVRELQEERELSVRAA
jgi:UDP-glucuronate decarboxylase